jgi:hypothetical protein
MKSSSVFVVVVLGLGLSPAHARLSNSVYGLRVPRLPWRGRQLSPSPRCHDRSWRRPPLERLRRHPLRRKRRHRRRPRLASTPAPPASSGGTPPSATPTATATARPTARSWAIPSVSGPAASRTRSGDISNPGDATDTSANPDGVDLPPARARARAKARARVKAKARAKARARARARARAKAKASPMSPRAASAAPPARRRRRCSRPSVAC